MSFKSKSNLSSYLLHYTEACNKLVGPISASFPLQATRLSKKCCSGGKPLATLYSIWLPEIWTSDYRSSDERVTAQPNCSVHFANLIIQICSCSLSLVFLHSFNVISCSMSLCSVVELTSLQISQINASNYILSIVPFVFFQFFIVFYLKN